MRTPGTGPPQNPDDLTTNPARRGPLVADRAGPRDGVDVRREAGGGVRPLDC